MQTKDAIILYQLSWFEQGRRPVRIDEDAVVGNTVKVTRQVHVKLRT